jgi:hypothetical protein
VAKAELATHVGHCRRGTASVALRAEFPLGVVHELRVGAGAKEAEHEVGVALCADALAEVEGSRDRLGEVKAAPLSGDATHVLELGHGLEGDLNGFRGDASLAVRGTGAEGPGRRHGFHVVLILEESIDVLLHGEADAPRARGVPAAGSSNNNNIGKIEPTFQ